MTALLDAALLWHQQGQSVVPARPDGSKAPAAFWKQYMAERPSEQQVRAWFATDSYDGLGLICGSVSGNLEMFELEGRAVTAGLGERLGQALADHGLRDLWQRLTDGYLEQTPSGGLHWLYRVNGEPRRNLKLARRLATPDELTANPAERIKVLIETRGEGGFTIVAPSGGRTHPQHAPWRLLRGGPRTVPLLSEDERDALHAIAGLLDEMPDDPPPAALVAGGAARSPGDIRPGEDYNRRATWEEILVPRGWQHIRSFGDTKAWRRPGKRDGISATTGRNDGDNLYVFSSSTEFDVEKPYSKFAALALLEHGGDFSACARALAAAGYGSRGITASVRPLQAVPDPTPAAPADTAPTDGTPAVPLADDGLVRTSWWPRDLAPIVTGEQPDEPAPAYLARADGHRLAYAGKVNALIGESESGKTWVALLAVQQALQVAEHVLYLDFEDTAPGIVSRLRSMGTTAKQLQHLSYISPDESLHAIAERDLREHLGEHRPGLVVVDGVNAAMTLLGLDLEKNKDATHFSQAVLRPLKRTGAAVLTVDHVTKAKEGRGNYAIGAQAKRADIDGCALLVEVQQPFGRGMSGKLRLTVSKDRPGQVRAVSGGAKYAGAALLVSTGDSVHVHIEAPDLRPADQRPAFRPTALMERVSRFLETLDSASASRNAIEKEVPGKAEFIRTALDVLVTEGYITREIGPRNSTLHASVRAYREGSDPAAEGSLAHLVPTSSHLVPDEVKHHRDDLVPPAPSPTGAGRGRGASNRSTDNPTSSPPDEDEVNRWWDR